MPDLTGELRVAVAAADEVHSNMANSGSPVFTGPLEQSDEFRIVIGDFDRHELPGTSGARVTLVLPAGWPADRRAHLRARFSEVLDLLAGFFGRAIDTEYSITLVDTGDALMDLTPGATQHGVVLGWPGDIPIMWHEASRLIASYWTKQPDTRNRFELQDERWLAEGIAHWAAYYVTVQLGDYSGDDVLGSLHEYYAHVLSRMPTDIRDVATGDVRLTRDEFATRSLIIFDYLNQVVGEQPLASWVRETYRDRGTDVNLSRFLDGALSAAQREEYRRLIEEGVRPVGRGRLPAVGARDTLPAGEEREWGLELLVTADTDAYIEHCGCKLNQDGGLARRATVLAGEAPPWPRMALDLGDNLPGDFRKRILPSNDIDEFGVFLSALSGLGYDSLPIGEAEVMSGRGALLEEALQRGFQLESANTTLRGYAPKRYWVERLPHGERVVFIPLLAPGFSRFAVQPTLELGLRDFVVESPGVALYKIMEDAQLTPTDTVIAYGAINVREASRLLREIDVLDTVITSRRATVWDAQSNEARPTQALETLPNGKSLVVDDIENYGILRLRFARRPDGDLQPFDTEYIILDSTVQEDPSLRAAIDAWYAELYPLGTVADEMKLPLHEDRLADAAYVGVAACQDCHEAQNAQWLTTDHATAVLTLVKERRHSVPSCIRCHVVGYGESPGYAGNLEKDAFANVQCESCHGPGSRHVEDPQGNDMLKLMTPSTVDICSTCHTRDHSDMTIENFFEYWSQVAHD